MTDVAILWRRLDRPGHESCRLCFRDSRWHLEGTAVFAHDGQPCRLDYVVACGAHWRTLSGRVAGWIGEQSVDLVLVVDPARGWLLDGAECDSVHGCLDLDLNLGLPQNGRGTCSMWTPPSRPGRGGGVYRLRRSTRKYW